MNSDKHHCEICGSPDAVYTDDPFILEIYDEHYKRWLCLKCAEDLWEDT